MNRARERKKRARKKRLAEARQQGPEITLSLERTTVRLGVMKAPDGSPAILIVPPEPEEPR